MYDYYDSYDCTRNYRHTNNTKRKADRLRNYVCM